MENFKLTSDRLLVGCIIILSIIIGGLFAKEVFTKVPSPSISSIVKLFNDNRILLEENKRLLEENIRLIESNKFIISQGTKTQEDSLILFNRVSTELVEQKERYKLLEDKVLSLLGNKNLIKGFNQNN